MKKLMFSGDAASVLGISRQAFHQCYLSKKRIKPVAQTGEGYNLFDPRDVNRLRKEVEKKRAG